MRVVLTDSANSTWHYLKSVNAKLAADMLRWIKALGADPWFSTVTGEVKTTTRDVFFLKKRGYDVRRMWSTDFDKFRIFYFVDEEDDLVKVCEIVCRDGNTYDKLDEPHIIRIMQEYTQHFEKKRQR